MFNVNQNPEFTHPVKVMVPVDGGHETQTFKARFRALNEDAYDDFDLASIEGQKEFLKAVIVKFEDLVGDDEQAPIPYSDALRDKMLGIPFVRMALQRTYALAVTETQTGN